MKLGLFGGTFDPIHNAHLFIAEAARRRLGLDRMIFLPTRAAHHREPPAAGVADRIAMVRVAIAGNPAFALDETDCDEHATGYTADLLPRLRARYPGDDLTFLVGADSLVASPWRRFDEVLTAVEQFAIAPRIDGRSADDDPAALEAALAPLPPTLRAKVEQLDLPPLAASATVIRAQLAAGATARYLIPEPVYRYILEHDLYRP